VRRLRRHLIEFFYILFADMESTSSTATESDENVRAFDVFRKLWRERRSNARVDDGWYSTVEESVRKICHEAKRKVVLLVREGNADRGEQS
jgi:hypothetical protein